MSEFDGEFFTQKGTAQTEKLVPYFRRSSIQFFFFNHLGGGTSVLVEKHLSVSEPYFYKRILSILISYQIQEESYQMSNSAEEVSC